MENQNQASGQVIQQPNYNETEPNQRYIRAAQIGILLIITGVIISIGVQGFAQADSGGIYDFYASYPEWVNQVTTFGAIIYYIGLSILLLGLFTLAVSGKELHLHMRVGLLISFAIVFAAGMNAILSFSLNSLF